MFKRVHFAEWQPILTIVVFFITLAVFAYFAWRAARMKPSERERVAAMPLEDETPTITSSSSEKSASPTASPRSGSSHENT